MDYRTPNIDRIARDEMLFTDCYAEQRIINVTLQMDKCPGQKR
jgi:hypothetical protein